VKDKYAVYERACVTCRTGSQLAGVILDPHNKQPCRNTNTAIGRVVSPRTTWRLLPVFLFLWHCWSGSLVALGKEFADLSRHELAGVCGQQLDVQVIPFCTSVICCCSCPQFSKDLSLTAHLIALVIFITIQRRLRWQHAQKRCAGGLGRWECLGSIARLP
jgi:hypothetical protein